MNYKKRILNIALENFITPFIVVGAILAVNIALDLVWSIFSKQGFDGFSDFGGISVIAVFGIMIASVVMGAITSIQMKKHMQMSVSRVEGLLFAWVGHIAYFISCFTIVTLLYLIFDRGLYPGKMFIYMGIATTILFFGIGYFFSGVFTNLKGVLAGLSIPAFILSNIYVANRIVPNRVEYTISGSMTVEQLNSNIFGNFPTVFLIYGIVLIALGTVLFFVKTSQMRSNQLT